MFSPFAWVRKTLSGILRGGGALRADRASV